MQRYRLFLRGDNKVIEQHEFPAMGDIVAETPVEGRRDWRSIALP